MTISKRLRYEIFRRDGHACRYCGATPPDVTLTVDHVTPRVLGGGNEPTNLVTACAACNAGKGTTSIDDPTILGGPEDRRLAAMVATVLEERIEETGRLREQAWKLLSIWERSCLNGPDLNRSYEDPRFEWDYADYPENAEGVIMGWLAAGLDYMLLLATMSEVRPWGSGTGDHLWPAFADSVNRQLRSLQTEARARLAQADREGEVTL